MLSDLFAERARVWLTIFAIAWGTLSIGLMLGIGEGLRQNFGKNMHGIGEDLLILNPGMSTKPYRGQAQQVIRFNLQDLQRLKSLPGVMTVTPEYASQKDITLTVEKKEYHTTLSGVEPEYGILRKIQPKAGGRFINFLDNKQQSLVIVLGSDTAQQLSVAENQRITLNNIPFTVVGILAPKPSMLNYQRPDNYMAWIPESVARALWGDTIATFVFKLATQTDHKALKTQITQTIALARGLAPGEPDMLHILDAEEIQKKTDQFLLGMEIFLGVAGALTIIVAGAGIANVMFASVSSATCEIGVRKALGAQNYQILLYYVYQSLLITAIGGCIGILLSMAIAALINHLPLISGALVNNIGKPQVLLSSAVLVTIVSILGLIGLLAGLFPARRAAKVDPVVALRSH
ncbi:MAG: hypothetical protein K0S11_39 [Gammaproteobacteria bacterium]|jgi:putative ABC transport system permease protein|nr:hypothetical protein [Gammaproteobacteria bacterium]